MTRKFGVDFEPFNRNFFAQHKDELHFFGKKMVKHISDTKIAEISLYEDGIVGQYVGYNVQINHKENGVITSNAFYFEEFFSPENRTDGRSDYKGAPHINKGTCSDGIARWYITVPAPKEIKALANKIIAYISFYS